MTDMLRVVFQNCRKALNAAAQPLRADSKMANLTLAIPDVHNTTTDGDVGWANRPPALVACPQCATEIYQKDSRDSIDCTRCTADRPADEFSELELITLVCPSCGDHMKHGRRHPQQFDVPEWATCPNCSYHWEFDHMF